MIEELCEKLKNAAQGDGPAKDEDGSAVADEADPMLRLEDLKQTLEDLAAKRRKTVSTR